MMEHILFLGLNDKNTRAQEIATLDAYKITMAAVIRAGYEGGRWYTVERIANGYTRREIARLLRAALLDQINGGAA